MDVEIGTEAEQFPEKEYINGIFVDMHVLPSPCVYRTNALLFVYRANVLCVTMAMCYCASQRATVQTCNHAPVLLWTFAIHDVCYGYRP